MRVFIASLYPAHSRIAGDCLPEFFPTRFSAEIAAEAEIRRVAAMPLEQRDPAIDWAVRYTVRAVRG